MAEDGEARSAVVPVTPVLQGEDSAALFRLAVEAAPNAMVMVNQEGAIVLVNQQAERLFGYRRDELLGQAVEMLVPERSRGHHPAHRGGYVAQPDNRPMGSGRDLYGLTRDGREVPIEIGLNPLKTAAGTFILASIIDITERKRAEERLLQVIEAAPNAMVMVGSDGSIALVNAQTEKLFGYPRNELIGRRVEMLVPERNRGQHPQKRDGYFTDPHPRSMGIGRDLYGLTRDGREVPIEIGLNPLRTDRGTYVLASIIDITERKRVEDAVRQSEARFRMVVEAAPNAMIMVDVDGRITLVNAQTEKLFGHERGALIGQPVEMLVPVSHRAAHPDLRRGYFSDPRTRYMGVGRDLYGLTAAGQQVPIEIGLNPIETSEGKFVLASIIDITERKRAEERLLQVIEAAPNAMVMVGSDGCIALVNAQTEKLFGYPRNELIGRAVEMLVPERNREQHPQKRDGYFTDPHPRSMGIGRDLYGLTRDGREVPIEIGLNPLTTDRGTFVLASIIDITERKRVEDAVRQSESRFRLMVSSVKDYAILMLDPEGRVVSWNDGAQRLKGYTEAEILGRHFSVFYTPEDVAADRPQQELQQARDQGRFEDEGWRLRRDGSRFWASVIVTPMVDEKGLLSGYSKVTRDITERRRSEERFRMVVEAAPNAMIMVDTAGRITLVNAQTEKLFGYERSALIGQPVEMLVPEGHRRGHPDLRRSYFGEPRTRSMGVGRDLYGLTSRGQQVPIEIGLNPIETSEGTFVLASIIDITERKRAEQALRDLNQSLAAQIDETTAAMAKLQFAQGQLVQAEKLASLGGLVAGIAHEINTPVGIGVTAASHLEAEVRAMTKAMSGGTLTKSQFERYLQVFAQSSDIILLNLRRASELIQSFKRVAVDQSSNERRRIHLRAYFEEVLVSLRPKMKATPHHIELECPADLEIDTIPGAWSQVLTNLVVNALSHAFEPSRPGCMRIVVERQGEGVQVIFSDDGRGIPADILPKVFDPFFTTRRGQGGTGLGLHIVFNIVHQTLGGTISVDSQPGVGTRFTMNLPLSAHGMAP